MKSIFLFILFAVFIAGCGGNEEEPKVSEPQKDNLVENHLTYHNYKDSVTFHQTTRIYVHSKLVDIKESTFSLPALGTKTIKIEDADGNEKDTVVGIPYGISFSTKEEK
jgi:uncharacterized lipoprotein YehR (DUF1307 family)